MSDDHRLRINSIIGNYQIKRLIGKGGMGEVYEAYEPVLERKVALKIVAEDVSNMPDILAYFKNEGKALARINHPYIVSIYSFGQDQGIEYIAMEYLEGENLRKLIKSKIFNFQDSLKIFKFLLSAVKELHKNQIIHRDLKPQNIIIQEGHKPKIVDFGIAKRLNDEKVNDKSERIMGSIFYLAPEVLTGKGVSEQSDIWSLGVILFEMITYRRPFNGNDRAEMTNCIVNNRLEFTLYEKLRIPKRIQEIIKKMCEKELDKRYQTITELEHDLHNWDKTSEYDTLPTVSVTAPSEFIIETSNTKQFDYKIKRSLLLAPLFIFALIIYYEWQSLNSLIKNQDSSTEAKKNIYDADDSPVLTDKIISQTLATTQIEDIQIETSEIYKGEQDHEINIYNQKTHLAELKDEQQNKIETVETFVPLAPTRLQSEQKVVLKFSKNNRSVASKSVQPLNSPVLRWESIPNSTGYELQIANDANFKKIIFKQKNEKNYFNWVGVKPGNFYWRVRSYDGDLKSHFSQKKSIHVILSPPLINGPILKTVILPNKLKKNHMESIKVNWSDVPLANNFEYQISMDPSFNTITKGLVKKNSATLKLGVDKNYFIRVAATDASGRFISSFSPSQEIKFQSKIRLSAPKLLVPDTNSEISFNSHVVSFLAFSWQNITDSKSYDIEISKDLGFKKILLKQNVKDSKFITNKKIPKGKYFWRVRSKSDENYSNWSSSFTFIIQ